MFTRFLDALHTQLPRSSAKAVAPLEAFPCFILSLTLFM